MRSKTWAVHILVPVLAGLVPTAPATAYDPAPLCSYPESGRADRSFSPFLEHEEPRLLMCAPRAPVEPLFEPTLDDEDARRALARARALADRGRYSQAILALRVVAKQFPRLADRFALEEGQYRMKSGADRLACEAFERAETSPHRDVAAQAEVAKVSCLLEIGDRSAERKLEELRRNYPELPQVDELELLLARSYELRGDRQRAAARYRDLDLMSPGSPHAQSAREALARLRAEGVRVRELTLAQQADRAERLTRGGYYEMARSEIARLRGMDLPRPIAQQVARSAARIARIEGRWEDEQRLLREAAGHPVEESTRSEAEEDSERKAQELEAELRRLLRGRPLSRQPAGRLMVALQHAARGGLRERVDALLREVVRRNNLPPGVVFDAAIVAAGTGDDTLVAQLFERVRTKSRYAVAARYHYGRTLERLGRIAEARREYAEVIAQDDSRLPYYALWARQRMRETSQVDGPAHRPLARLPAEVSCGPGPYTAFPLTLAAKLDSLEFSRDEACTAPSDPRLLVELPFETAPHKPTASPERPRIELSRDEMADILAPLVDAHGDAFPWLGRAHDLVLLGETRAASDELHATYTAFREAHGGSLRAGFVAVLRGSTPPRHRVDAATWRERRRLPPEARAALGRVSAALGDDGLAIRWNGFGLTGPRPRPYESIVEDAARRHGVEPELLFAVMRVESVYNPRIISYAGAIGLMQIMPRTGRLIAHRLGRDDFTVDQLLIPEVNIEFAAWYLSSLIRRWDGRLPLALASYNGGPHNVRRWMRDHADEMPLDAFLERIPFSQTHRYVRRVLTHYEAYRAQRGLAPAPLHLELPPARPDPTAF